VFAERFGWKKKLRQNKYNMKTLHPIGIPSKVTVFTSGEWHVFQLGSHRILRLASMSESTSEDSLSAQPDFSKSVILALILSKLGTLMREK
jgi:hypothetical protein